MPALRFYCLALISALALFLLSNALHAADQMTAQDIADMQKAMKEAQDMMKNMDPATRKQMEAVMQQAGAAAKGSSTDAVPINKSAKLAKVDKHAMTPAELKAYIDKLQPKFAKALTPAALQRANKVDVEMKKSPDYLPRLRAAANGLATLGAWPEAIYIEAKLADASGDAQDISNLAAFMTILHAETAALPILHTLDARYPNNSTILNNLGQAYYQLGASADAEKYLIAAIRFSPKHPQANMTRSMIQEARGDHAGAQISAHNALQGGYSNSKEQQLRKSGGKLTRDDVKWRRPLPADPLGVQSIKPSVYPESVDDLPRIIALEKSSQVEVDAQVAKFNQRAASIPPSSLAQMSSVLSMPFYQRTTALLGFDLEANRIPLERLYKTQTDLMTKMVADNETLSKKIAALDAAGEKKYANVPGGYQFDYTCGDVKKLIQNFLDGLVPAFRENEAQIADITLRQTNEQVYLSQFIMPANEFERAKWNAKATLTRGPVGAVEVLRPLEGVVEQRNNACWGKKKEEQKKNKLRDYNDIHCDYITEFGVPGMASMAIRCDKTDVKFDAPFLPFEAAWTTKATGRGGEETLVQASAAISVDAVKVGGHSEFDENGWKSGGVNVGVTADVGKVKGGPLEIGAQVGVTGSLEFDRSGVTDVGVTAGVGASASSTVAQTDAGGQMQSTLKSDAGATWSWSSGFSGDASGGFDSSVLDL